MSREVHKIHEIHEIHETIFITRRDNHSCGRLNHAAIVNPL